DGTAATRAEALRWCELAHARDGAAGKRTRGAARRAGHGCHRQLWGRCPDERVDRANAARVRDEKLVTAVSERRQHGVVLDRGHRLEISPSGATLDPARDAFPDHVVV